MDVRFTHTIPIHKIITLSHEKAKAQTVDIHFCANPLVYCKATIFIRYKRSKNESSRVVSFRIIPILKFYVFNSSILYIFILRILRFEIILLSEKLRFWNFMIRYLTAVNIARTVRISSLFGSSGYYTVGLNHILWVFDLDF